MFWPRRRGPYCCPGLGHLIANAGQVGLAALAWDLGTEVVLRLQSRGIAYVNEHRVADEPDPRDRLWNVSTSWDMSFCPFCGTEIRRLVRSTPRHFAALAAEHRKYSDECSDRPIRGHKRALSGDG